jgi:membrane-associated phospholipid phosphatase
MAVGSLLLVLFSVLTVLTVVHVFRAPDRAADRALHDYVLAHPGLASATRTVTAFGQPAVTLGIGLAAALVSYLRRDQQRAYFFGAAAIGAYALDYLFKEMVDRPRPRWRVPVYTESGPSYPSGHAAGTSAMAIALIVGALPFVASALLRWAAAVVLVLYVAVESFSRLLLGVHYPSDVVGGALLGVGWALLGAAFLVRPPGPAESVQSFNSLAVYGDSLR